MATATETLRGTRVRNNESFHNALRVIRTILTYALLIFFALLLILPFVYAIVNSFKTPADIAQNPQLLYPTMGWTTQAYSQIFGPDQNFGRWLFNSFFVSIIITIGHIIFDSMAGYALARIHFPGRGLAFAFLLGTMMVPG